MLRYILGYITGTRNTVLPCEPMARDGRPPANPQSRQEVAYGTPATTRLHPTPRPLRTGPFTHPRPFGGFAHLCRLASPSYLTEKITSSLISSLATGVPLLVDEGFLRSYSMLDNSTAFVMQPGETLCAAYNRIRGMAAEDYWAQRSRLLALAARLNEEAAQWFGEVLQKAQEGANYSSASKGQQ